MVTIKDCEVQTFRSGGKGGQHQNKVSSGVRIIHHPSGARGECRSYREQLRNKREAFRKMAESKTFQIWAKMMLFDIIAELDEQMNPRNLKVEYGPFED